MDFDLDEQQNMLRDLVARFAADRSDLAARAASRANPEGFSRENWRTLAEMGLLALPFAGEHGGLDGGPVELITVMEQFGRGLSTEPYIPDLLLGGALLAHAGSDAQRGEWLPRIISGEARVALAHFEHAARFNPALINTIEGEGRLSGAKTFVLGGEGVDAYIISSRDGNADGVTLWLVRADAAGLDRRSYRLVDGSVACELRFHDLQEAQRLPGDGALALQKVFDTARLAAAAETLGIMTLLFDATLEHVRTRRQFGQPIGSFQAVQHRLADLYVLLEQSRSHLLRAALTQAGDKRAAAIAAAKSYIAASAIKLGEECIQFHGGMGITDELAIGHGHKRILLLATLLGDADSELMRYAKLTG